MYSQRKKSTYTNAFPQIKKDLQSRTFEKQNDYVKKYNVEIFGKQNRQQRCIWNFFFDYAHGT